MASPPVVLLERQALWEQVLESVRGQVRSDQTFDTWFKPLAPIRLSPEVVEIEVPNAFFVDWIHEHHLGTLRQGLTDVLGAEPEVRLIPREPSADGAPSPSSPPVALGSDSGSAPARPRDRLWLESQLSPRLTFANFLVGGSNEFTHAACSAVAERPGDAYNPLFIFADSGLGKTHLLHAIGHAVKQARPAARVYYVPAERFMNEMIYSIQHAQTLAFRNKHRNVDLLLIDDIQFLAGKESTQEEFFYTFNALRDAHKQVVVTADKPPKDIPMLEQRLISRFNQGLVTDIKQPGLETRLAILRQRGEQEAHGVSIPDDVLLLIADRIRSNVRDLEGCLVRLLALGSLLRREITVDLAEDVLRQYVREEPDRLTPEQILAAVAADFGARPEALYGRRRTQSVVMPRQVAMYLTRQLTGLSLVEIGRSFGGRDHSTVLHACQKVAGMINTDEPFAQKVNGIISTLGGG